MINVLFLAANPIDTLRLHLDQESREIANSLRESSFRDSISFQQSLAVRASDIASLLLRYSPDIVHFSGHGTPTGDIILEDATGHSYPVSSDALVALFSFMKDITKCVILGTVFSDSTAKALSQHIDYVIGMQGEISDESAISFSRGFYSAIAFGKSIKTAYDFACIQIRMIGNNEEHIPKLFSRFESDFSFNMGESSQGALPKSQSDLEQKRTGISPPIKGYSGTILNERRTLGVFVGVNTYDDPLIPNLRVCVNDVSSIFKTLKTNEAKLLCTGNSTADMPMRNHILSQLQIASRAAEKTDLLIFYFSGHGFAEEGESYLVSADTNYVSLKYTAVSMRDISELMKKSEAKAKVIVLDACHSGVAIGKDALPISAEFIRHIYEEAEGTVVLASCKQGEQSFEYPGQNSSVFTYFLLEALHGAADVDRKGFVTVSDAYRYVTNALKMWSKRSGLMQTPTLQAEVVGEIVLVREY